MPIALLDVSDAHVLPLRGWGRYVAELARALGEVDGGDLVVREAARDASRSGPELAWEQWGLPRRARRLGAAVMHAPNCFLALRRPCAGVVTVHDLAFETHRGDFAAATGLKYRTLVPRAVRSAERVICVSQFTARDVQERYGVPAERVRVVPLAPALGAGSVSGERATASSAAPAAPYLLGVGDLRGKKDFITLVRAWLALRAEGRDLRLVLAGADLGQGPVLRALAGAEPLELRGYVGDAELDALLRGASAMVHPSRHEGFGLVLLEAMARDTPVVAADATALPETGGDAALYFAPGDPAALADVLRGLLDDPALRRDLTERGRVRAAAHTWQRTALETLAVYREALQ
jgi:glycosyltransferase involved in cell wall biosynthesis